MTVTDAAGNSAPVLDRRSRPWRTRLRPGPPNGANARRSATLAAQLEGSKGAPDDAVWPRADDCRGARRDRAARRSRGALEVVATPALQGAACAASTAADGRFRPVRDARARSSRARCACLPRHPARRRRRRARCAQRARGHQALGLTALVERGPRDLLSRAPARRAGAARGQAARARGARAGAARGFSSGSSAPARAGASARPTASGSRGPRTTSSGRSLNPSPTTRSRPARPTSSGCTSAEDLFTSDSTPVSARWL